MNTMKVHILMYHPDSNVETKFVMEVPVAEQTAARLLAAQRSGVTIWEQTALQDLAGAIAWLNGLRGLTLRVEEVRA